MKVINLIQDDIDQFYEVNYSNFNCDNLLIVGVANGGLPLSEGFYNYMSNRGGSCEHAEIKCQRPSTKVKKSFTLNERLIKMVFKFVPTFVLNKLRVLEHNKLSKRKSIDLERDCIWLKKPARARYSQILIIDDAIDSGASLKRVYNEVYKYFPSSEINTSVIVCTQDKPLFDASFTLFKNVLVRFPWSLDAK